MRPRWRKVLRDLSAHRFRTALVVVSIAIGVFAVGVVLGTREVLVREFDADFASSAPPSVTYHAQDFDAELVDRAEADPDVAAVSARRAVSLRYRSRDGAEDRTLLLQAIPDFIRIPVATVVPTGEGAWPPGPGEVVLEASAKQVADHATGDVLTIERADGTTVEAHVAGFAHDINAVPAQFVGFETGYITFETLELLGEPARFNRLSIVLADQDLTWSEASRRAAELRKRLFEDAGLRVFMTDVPEPGSHFLGDIFKAVSLLLLALGVLALGLAGFLVVNTVGALMAQQVRQVGIMKAVGARAGQLETLYGATVALYGVLAVALGLPAAAFASRWFTDFAAGILNFRVTDYTPPAWVTVVEVAVGVVVPLAAAAAPVRAGTRMSVVRALNATGMASARFGHSVADRVLSAIRGLPRPVALSLRNTFLRKGRLALTLSTLALASAVVVSVWSVRASIERTIDELESWWRYGVQITFAQPEDAASVEAVARTAQGVVDVETWMTYGATLVRTDGTENESFAIVGLDPGTDLVGPILLAGRWLQPGDEGAVVVNTDARNAEAGTDVGSTVRLRVQGKERTWRVVGVIKGQLGGPTVFCVADDLATVLGHAGATQLVVRGSDSSDAAERALRAAVESRLTDAGYHVAHARTRTALADQLREQLGILVAFLVVMAAILAAVGVIGLTGTMTINVLESTREIGVMRAIGAEHRSIYQIFVTEGVAVGVIAWALGAVAAYPLSVALVHVLDDATGVPLSYAFSWAGVGGWLVLMLLISGTASVAPAFRASQVSVRDAIAYE